MKKIYLLTILLLIPAISSAYNIPFFNFPHNNYKLFSYKEKTHHIIAKNEQINSQDNDITVSGILKTVSGNLALINHKICKVGDTIKGYKIEKIEKNNVIFLKDGKQIVKSLETKMDLIFKDNLILNNN